MNSNILTPANLSQAEMEGLIPKYIHLREHLRRELAKLEPGVRMPSVAELRKRYQVSQSTFDRAIEGLRAEGVVHTHQGKGMFTTKLAQTRRVGMIFGQNIFAAEHVHSQLLLQALQGQARERDHLLYYFFQDAEGETESHTPQQLELEIRAGRLDGLLASSGLGVHPDGWDHLSRFGLPFVAFAHRGKLPNRVCLDWAATARIGAETLLRQGCRRLALWHRNPYYDEQSSAAFFRPLVYAGARTRPEWNVVAPCDAPVDAVAETLFREKWSEWDEKPDGIVCLDDIITQGILRAAKLEGICLMDDLRIASHANKGSNCWGSAPVTRLEIDQGRVADAMLQRLDLLIDGQRPEPDVLFIKPTVPHPPDAG